MREPVFGRLRGQAGEQLVELTGIDVAVRRGGDVRDCACEREAMVATAARREVARAVDDR